MKVEIISIGDELLIGQVVNTNATWMAEQLSINGYEVCKISNIKDDEQEIIKSLDLARSNADIVLISGGLGPTKDDITKTTLARYFDSNIVFDEKAYNIINSFFIRRGLPITEVNKRQADILEKCTPIYNKNGTASGMWIEEKDAVFVSMPGVPFEMKAMFEEDILPMLKNRFNTQASIYKTVLTTGIGESFLSEIIQEWEDKLPKNIKLAYLPSPGIVRLRISATGNNKAELSKTVDKTIDALRKTIPDKIFGYDKDTLEKVIGELLIQNNKTISTAESCTGGYIGHLLTSVAGSSGYYKGSIVSYSNEAKTNLLAVKQNLIEKYGAVSEEVVAQMARGAKEKLNTDYAVATSGIAGPEGGSEEKPVGTTWIAVANNETVVTKKFLFGSNRGRNIRMTAISALNMLRKNILDEQ